MTKQELLEEFRRQDLSLRIGRSLIYRLYDDIMIVVGWNDDRYSVEGIMNGFEKFCELNSDSIME